MSIPSNLLTPNGVALKGFPGYSITPAGKVFHYDVEKKLIIKKGRSVKVRIGLNGITRELGLATIIAQHFVPNPHHYKRIAFKDGNNHNCCASNIEWISDTAFAHATLFKDKVFFNDERKVIQKKKRKPPELPVEREPDSVEIPGCPGYYITRSAKVYHGHKPLTISHQKGGKSLAVYISVNGQKRILGLAKLIALTFLPNPFGYIHVIFKDRNNKNCSADNVMWANGVDYNRYVRSFKKDPEFGSKTTEPDPDRRPIPGYDDLFITCNATVYYKDRILFKRRGKGRADRVIIQSADGVKKHVTVAKLLAGAFIPNPEGHKEVIFKDRNLNNCSIENLQWVSSFEFNSFKKRNCASDELLGASYIKKVKATVWIDPERIPVEGFEGYYITPSGVVYRRHRIVRPHTRKNKSLIIRIKPTGSSPKTYRHLGLATLVAIHFLPNPRNRKHIIFKDRDHHNCHVDNIAWVDAQTFAFYAGLFNFHKGRKKIVVERQEAIRTCTDEYIKRYYITLDEAWLEEAWNRIEKTVNVYDWEKFRSECYMYFMDRARRFSISKSAKGLMIVHVKSLRIKLQNEISPEMPIGLLMQTDESMRTRSGEGRYRSKWSGRQAIPISEQEHRGDLF